MKWISAYAGNLPWLSERGLAEEGKAIDLGLLDEDTPDVSELTPSLGGGVGPCVGEEGAE